MWHPGEPKRYKSPHNPSKSSIPPMRRWMRRDGVEATQSTEESEEVGWLMKSPFATRRVIEQQPKKANHRRKEKERRKIKGVVDRGQISFLFRSSQGK